MATVIKSVAPVFNAATDPRRAQYLAEYNNANTSAARKAAIDAKWGFSQIAPVKSNPVVQTPVAANPQPITVQAPQLVQQATAQPVVTSSTVSPDVLNSFGAQIAGQGIPQTVATSQPVVQSVAATPVTQASTVTQAQQATPVVQSSSVAAPVTQATTASTPVQQNQSASVPVTQATTTPVTQAATQQKVATPAPVKAKATTATKTPVKASSTAKAKTTAKTTTAAFNPATDPRRNTYLKEYNNPNTSTARKAAIDAKWGFSKSGATGSTTDNHTVDNVQGGKFVQGTATSGTNIGTAREIAPAEIGDAQQVTASTIDQAQQAEFRQKQIDLANALQDQLAGKGVSLAALQEQAATDRAIKQQYGLALANRGLSSGLASRQAALNVADLSAQAANASAQMRAQDQLNAQNTLGNVLSTGRAGDIDLAEQQAKINQEAALANAGYVNQFKLSQADLIQKAMEANQNAFNSRQIAQGQINGGIQQASIGASATVRAAGIGASASRYATDAANYRFNQQLGFDQDQYYGGQQNGYINNNLNANQNQQTINQNSQKNQNDSLNSFGGALGKMGTAKNA